MKQQRSALCHPNRKHYAKGMCQHCYQSSKNAAASPHRSPQDGLVRVPIKGWGCIA